MMSIQARLHSIETKRIRLQQVVSGIEPEVVAARPRPDKWSIQEIVEHLVLSESRRAGIGRALKPSSRRGVSRGPRPDLIIARQLQRAGRARTQRRGAVLRTRTAWAWHRVHCGGSSRHGGARRTS